VLGDDRAEPPDLVDDFRAAGLSHLTAVSGENLAFALALAGPLLRRLALRWRFVATAGLVAWFALLTRFEPSVLRACVMAALAALAVVLARPASTVRLLALAVSVLVLVDPLLVWSVGWWLSVGATAGIALLAAPLAARLPGPRPLAEALASPSPPRSAWHRCRSRVRAYRWRPSRPTCWRSRWPDRSWCGACPPASRRSAAGSGAVLHLPTRLAVRWIALVARTAAAARWASCAGPTWPSWPPSSPWPPPSEPPYAAPPWPLRIT
jgi:ComEC/Rec2-related protein